MAHQELSINKLSADSQTGFVGDVVFIHGLGGDARNTWTNKDKEFWPLWLAADIPKVCVWTLGYPAAATHWWGKGASFGLSERAVSLLDYLVSNRLGERPIIFIGHSLGGLMIKKLLQHAATKEQKNWAGVDRNVRGVIFFATPHNGASLDKSIRMFRGRGASEMTKALNFNNAELQDLGNWYRAHVNDREFATHAYYEKEGIPLIGLIVDESSANPGVQGCVPVALDGNHVEVCKPLARTSPAYAGSRHFVCKYIIGIPPTAQSAQDFVLEPTANTNHVFLGPAKEENGASFSFRAAFFLHVGNAQIIIKKFNAMYVAFGCYASPGTVKISIDKKEIETNADCGTFLKPVPINAKDSVYLEYSAREVLTPLASRAPCDCDYGDLEVTIEYMVGEFAEKKDIIKCYRFEVGGTLTSISSIRPVPRFSDEHLTRLLDTGFLDQTQFADLMKILPRHRYLAAHSTVTSDDYLNVSNELRLLLKRFLVTAPHE